MPISIAASSLLCSRRVARLPEESMPISSGAMRLPQMRDITALCEERKC
jgi:hypothetical protein